MPLFDYKAADAGGNLIQGQLDEPDEVAVLRRLQEMGHMPLEAVLARGRTARAAAPRRGRGARLKAGDVTVFTRELAILLAAGQPLERALTTMATGSETGAIGALAQRVVEGVRRGLSLSAVLEGQGPGFPPIYINMARAGESSGTLQLVLGRIAELRERAERLREMVVSAMLYPAILVFVSLASIYLLLTFVIPQFETVFRDAGAELPTPTRIVIALGRAAQDYGAIVLIALLAAILVLRRAIARPGPGLAWDRLMLRLPLIGPLLRTLVTARFCRTLATLVGNGVDLPTALALSRDVVPNRAVTAALDTVITGVRQGRGLADPLAAARLFPPLAIQMLRVGEETGRIDMTAGHVADAYERKLESALKRIVALVEPVLIIVLGLAVGGIVMSILLAVISINDLAM